MYYIQLGDVFSVQEYAHMYIHTKYIGGNTDTMWRCGTGTLSLQASAVARDIRLVNDRMT